MELDRLEAPNPGPRQAEFSALGNQKPRPAGPSGAETDDNGCWYCGKPGHYKRECRRYKADRASGKLKPTGGRPPAGRRPPK